MFARTERLTLRPGWMEDAPELARAAGHEVVIRDTGRMPWPYALGDAQAFLRTAAPLRAPALLVFAHENGGVRLIGGAGLYAEAGDCRELGYWLTPDAWGRGYATEAARAVLDMAAALRIRQLTARTFADNLASARVLGKLGFRATGERTLGRSAARQGEAPVVHYVRELAGSPPLPDLHDAPPLAA